MVLACALAIVLISIPHFFRNGFDGAYVQRVMIAQDAWQAEAAVTLLLEHLEARGLTHGSTSMTAPDRNLERWYGDLRRVRAELQHAAYESRGSRDQAIALDHAYQAAVRIPHWLRMYPYQRRYLLGMLSVLVLMILVAWRAWPVSRSRQRVIS
jgi:hypothetical protein